MNSLLSAQGFQSQLDALQGWTVVDRTIEKRFEFANFLSTIAFVNAVAWIAEQHNHHPDLQVGHHHCTVRYTTHSIGGLSMNDFACAAKIDALLP